MQCLYMTACMIIKKLNEIIINTNERMKNIFQNVRQAAHNFEGLDPQ